MTKDQEEVARAMGALRRIVRALRVSTKEVERAVGVSGARLFVLRQLAAEPRQSMRDLAARTLTTASTVSEIVAALVDDGLVQRRASADDARRAELTLTPRGRAIVDDAPVTAQQRLVEGFGRLPHAQRTALAAAMEAWLTVSGLADAPAPLFFEPAPARRRSSRRSRS